MGVSDGLLGRLEQAPVVPLVVPDDAALRKNPSVFEQLEGDYPVRREFDSHAIKALNVNAFVEQKLKALGFRILQEGSPAV